MNTDYETLRNESEVKQLNTCMSARSCEHKLNSQYIALVTSTHSTSNDNNAYEQAKNSLCATESDSDHYEHSTETTHVYKHLAHSGGQYDTSQDLPTSNIPAINSNDWDNAYYGIEDGSYSSIDGAYGMPSCNTDKHKNKNNEDSILTRYIASFKLLYTHI